jgi:ABC-type bacteriocin/lantibiotic exporter with double-glycine peptidase domain
VTFARALYSRAGILVLDDILSAVDAHVGRHIFFGGLAGPLGEGRTRILATHHTLLCLPGSDYAIYISRRGNVRELLTQTSVLSQTKIPIQTEIAPEDS